MCAACCMLHAALLRLCWPTDDSFNKNKPKQFHVTELSLLVVLLYIKLTQVCSKGRIQEK